MTEREILLRLIGSLALCDHMGDVADDVVKALDELGYKGAPFVCDDSRDLWRFLRKNGIFHGTLWTDADKHWSAQLRPINGECVFVNDQSEARSVLQDWAGNDTLVSCIPYSDEPDTRLEGWDRTYMIRGEHGNIAFSNQFIEVHSES